ncbi:MAG: STAS domain-containing protein [Azoarcus sp.]|jgi:phospholipid transport system transporter-binding protein|nr:STAS domain-containing protein [Azoarcus sp.]
MAEPSVVTLKGELTLETAVAHLGLTLPAGNVVLDFRSVTRVDSSALALLLAWLRRAKVRRSTVELRALPESLLALARLYGVDTLLPV